MANQGQIALVTGGNRGIGLEVVRQLAKRGLRVFLGSRKPTAGDKARFDIAGGDPSLAIDVLPIDIADQDSVKKAVRNLAEKVSHLDILINNAGILLDENTPVTEIDADTFARTLQTNAWGPLQVTQEFLPLLRKSKEARVINISSGAGSLNDMDSWAPAYSISKTALNAVTRQLSAALASDHIAVNSVCPGWVRTDMGGSSAPRSVEDGADTIVWLATDASSEITGQFLRDRKPANW